MKILVVSDTHGNYLAPLQCLNGKDVDLIIHLGDHIDDAKELEQITETPVIKVPGNCDPHSHEPRELLQKIKGHSIYMTHGDLYRVKSGVDNLLHRVAETKSSVALFGHTHLPQVTKHNGILLINPGTLMNGSQQKSCAILHVSQSKITAEILYIP